LLNIRTRAPTLVVTEQVDAELALEQVPTLLVAVLLIPVTDPSIGKLTTFTLNGTSVFCGVTPEDTVTVCVQVLPAGYKEPTMTPPTGNVHAHPVFNVGSKVVFKGTVSPNTVVPDASVELFVTAKLYVITSPDCTV
jgi:hypothetical protein